MKKKFLFAVLVLVTLLSVTSLTAMAADPEEEDTGVVYYDTGTPEPTSSPSPLMFEDGVTQDIDMYFTLTKAEGTNDTTKDYFIEVEWTRTTGSGKIEGDSYRWDASKRMYVRSSVENELFDITPAAFDITITNYSNSDITYDISFTAGDGYTVTATQADDSPNEASGIISGYVTAHQSIENGDAVGQASYAYTADAPYIEYKGQVTLNSNASTTAAMDGTVIGTYTVTLGKP